jgi:hypothetical protein
MTSLAQFIKVLLFNQGDLVKRRGMRFLSSMVGPLLVVALLSLVVYGCGSDSDSSTSAGFTTPSKAAEGGATITKAELIKKGDAICRKTDQRQSRGLKAYAKKHPQWEKTTSGQEKAIAKAGLPPIGVEAEELENLGVPERESATVNAIFTALERALDEAEKDSGSLFSQKENPFDEVDQLAGDYGFKACSNAL